jgi:L-iditol 2-dehydrogenase
MGSGIAGLLHIQLACTMGAGRVLATDVSENRLATAKRLGSDIVVHAHTDVSSELRGANDGWLADKVMVCTGARSANLQALGLVERGGTVLFFAPTDPGVTIPVSINDLFFRNDITLTTSYAGSPADHVIALALIRAHRVRVRDMITHRLSLEETSQGFELVAKAQDSIKVIIEPHR